MITAEETPSKNGSGRKWAAVLFALAALVALGYSAWRGRQRYLAEHPPALPNVLAPIPANQQKVVHAGMRFVGSVLQLTADQQKKLGGLWRKDPRSVSELIDYNKRTDEILTPEQRARLKPMRQVMQNQVIDRMLEPGRKSMPEQDFEKLKKEIKARAAQRIDGH